MTTENKNNGQNIVTDKELLTMIDLCNMKLEYANPKYIDSVGAEKNHTIYSILEAEINSFEEKQKRQEEYNKKIEELKKLNEIEEWEIVESLDAYNYGKYDFEYKKS